MARCANANVPGSCAIFLTAGGIMALNKIKQEEQAARVAKGQKPKLRPLNIGCVVLKWSFKVCLRTEEARVAIEQLRPIQMGLSAERGTEVVGHLFRALYEQGYIICTTDFSNGFNAFLRQSMLDAVHRRCPALTGVFNLFYALDSPCLFKVGDEYRVIMSTEGSRMGCTMGSFGFDLTVQDIYEAVRARFPMAVCKALTDDFSFAIKPSDDEIENLEETYQVVGNCLESIATESKARANLDLVPSKCNLLLTARASSLPPPSPSSLRGGVNVVTGLRLAGAPLGTGAFCINYINQQQQAVAERIKAVEHIHPQLALQMLSICTSHAPTFYYQVTPPQLTHQAATAHDQLTLDTIWRIMRPAGQPKPPTCSRERLARANAKILLPTRLNGVGVNSAVRTHALAFWSSAVASFNVDEDLNQHRRGLDRFAPYTLEAICSVVGPPSDLTRTIDTKIPRGNPLAFTDGSLYVALYDNSPGIKLQKELSDVANQVAHRAHLASCALTHPTVSESDFILEHSASTQSTIFKAPLSNPFFRFTPITFRRFFLQFTRMPNIPNTDQLFIDPSFDYLVGHCQANHKHRFPQLDLHNNHGNSGCPSSAFARYTRHNLVNRTIAKHATEAGFDVTIEPDTCTKLLARLYAPNTTAVLFPNSHSQVLRAKLVKLRGEIDQAELKPPGPAREKALRDHRALQRVLEADMNRSGKKALRADLLCIDTDIGQSGRSYVCDFTCISTTVTSNRKKETKDTIARLAQHELSRSSSMAPPLAPPYSVLHAAKTKVTKYSPLISLMSELHIRGLRDTPVDFLEMAMAADGSLGHGIVRFLEIICCKFKRKLDSEGDSDDGFTIPQRLSAFRRQLRLSIQIAAAKGEAMMHGAAGLPSEMLMKNRSDKARMPPPAAKPPGRQRAAKMPAAQAPGRSRKAKPGPKPHTIKKQTCISNLDSVQAVTVPELSRAPSPPQPQLRVPRVPPALMLSDHFPPI